MPMKYVALLRGINVGGNNSVKMSVLKEVLTEHGFSDVLTYINSGNVIFTSSETDTDKLTQEIEKLLTKTFSYNARVVIKSHAEFKKITESVPEAWNTQDDIRCYVAFLRNYLSVEEAVKEIRLREGVDTLAATPGAVYMTSKLSELTKSNFNKLAGKKIYGEMTIRNYNTTRKLLELLNEK